MSNQSTIQAETRPTWKSRKKKGAGKPAPAVVLNGSNFEEHFPPPPKKMGAPSTYSVEWADRVCAWVRNGKTLHSFCLQPGTPDITTIIDWRWAHPDFAQRYARAKDEGMDVYAERLIERSIDVRPSSPRVGASKWTPVNGI
jgi:hypothetical protein